MFRILLFSAFSLLLAAVGKFLFMDDYLPLEARRVAVSAALPSTSGLTDEQSRSARLFASARSGAEADSLFEDVLPDEGAASDLGADARAIARDLLGRGVEEPHGAVALPKVPPALPSADAKFDDIASAQPTESGETANGLPAREAVTAAALPSLPPGVVQEPARMTPGVPAADEGTAPPTPPAVADGSAEPTVDVRRSEAKPQVAAVAAAPSSSAAARKRSKESGREDKVAEKRPAAAAAARSQAPKQVAKVERSKPVVARSTATVAPRRERQPAGRAAIAPNAKAAGTYQARVGVPAGRTDERKLLARLEPDNRGAPARSKNEPTNTRNAATGGGGMARSTSAVNGDEMVSRWVGSVATGVQRLMGHELNSVTSPRSVVSYCRSQPESWVYDEGRKQMVYCGEVAAARSGARR